MKNHGILLSALEGTEGRFAALLACRPAAPDTSLSMSSNVAGHPDLLQALNGAPVLLGLIDSNDCIVWANEAFDQTFLRSHPLPISFADMLRQGFAGGFGVRIDCGDVEQFLSESASRRGSSPYRAFATDLVDGRWIWMTETVLADGGTLLVASDITSLKTHERLLAQAHRSAVEASLTDELTRASNRRHILSLCREALQADQQQPDGGPWVVVIDLDHFKAINDRHGHDGGDAVLRHFVQHCKAGLRPGDHLGRLGGEEFLLLLSNTNAASARLVVDRLRSTLSSCDGIDYNFSAGIAGARIGETAESVIARADAALYEAKGAGRKCTIVAADL